MIVPPDLPVGGRTRAIPGDKINAGLWAARQLAGEATYARPKPSTPSGKTGGSGSAVKLAYVYDDLGETAAAVRCFARVLNTDTDKYEPDTSSVLNARPGYSVSLSLSEGACCSSGATAAIEGGGLTVSDPLASGAVTGTSLDYSGAGVASDSTVAIKLIDINDTELTAAATVTSSGAWFHNGFDHSTLANGPIRVQITETTADSHVERTRHRVFTKAAGVSQTDVLTPTVAPDLLSSSDTGELSNDNITSVLRPELSCTSPVGADATGPYLKLYRRGVEVASGDDDSFATGTGIQKATFTPTSDAEWGPEAYTYTLSTGDGADPPNLREGGHSPVLLISHRPDDGDGGEITATAEVASDFDEDDASISVLTDATFVISNPTGDPDPATDATIPQPDPPFSGSDGDAITLLWDGAEWVVKPVDAWSRECFLVSIDGAYYLMELSPCPRRRTHAEHKALTESGS